MWERHEYENLKDRIVRLDRIHQYKIIEILKEASIRINESTKGLNINLSCCQPETLDQLLKYVDYVSDQETALILMEKKKKEIMDTYFA